MTLLKFGKLRNVKWYGKTIFHFTLLRCKSHEWCKLIRKWTILLHMPCIRNFVVSFALHQKYLVEGIHNFSSVFD